MELRYFGTNEREAGHYNWVVEENNLRKDYNFAYKEFDFDPYDKQKPHPKGTTTYIKTDKFSAIIITGSAADSRNGTVSTFFVRESKTKEELKDFILSIPRAVQLINAMPFTVIW